MRARLSTSVCLSRGKSDVLWPQPLPMLVLGRAPGCMSGSMVAALVRLTREPTRSVWHSLFPNPHLLVDTPDPNM